MSCLFMLPQGKLRRSQFSQKSSLCFSFCYFIFCECSVHVNLYMLMSPLQSTYGHMVEKTPCWMANNAARPWKERISSLCVQDSSHCVVCHPAICPSQAEFRSHCCPHISNLVWKIVRLCFFLGQTMKLQVQKVSFLLSHYRLSVDKKRKEN